MKQIIYPMIPSVLRWTGLDKILFPFRIFPVYLPRQVRRLSFLKTLSCLVAAILFITTFSFGQGPCPTSNCTSGDMTITKVELVDATTEGPLPSTCQPGQGTVQVKLKVTFNATAQTRYGFLIIGDILIDGQFMTRVWDCFPDNFTQGEHVRILDQAINWPCGSTITLSDVYTAWRQQAPATTICTYLNSDGTISNCSAIDPKCKFYGDQEFTIAAPLVANYTYNATCTGSSSFQQITFSSPASGTGATTGGNKPYQYSWEIKDATNNVVLTTSTNNPFVYQPASNHDLLVKLTVTDASEPAAMDDETKTVSVGLCCSPPSVTQDPSNQQVCVGSGASFSVSYSGGVPAPTIQWQVSTNSGSSWSNLSNAAPYSGVNTSTLNISTTTNGMNGYLYRAVLQSGEAGVCDAANSNAGTLAVDPLSVGGSVAAPQTICAGNQINASLTLSGNTGTVVKWQKSTSSNFTSGVTDIANTSSTLSAAQAGTLNQDTWFRAVVKSGTCSEANSSAVMITIQQPIGNNTIAASQVICSGTTPAGLTGSTPTGGDGSYNYQWQLKTSGGFSNISGANSIDYSPGVISEETQFRRIVSAGSACNSSTSNVITISISPESEIFSIQASSFCESEPNTGSITLGGSYPGVSYQLKNASDNSNVGSPQIGDGNPITWDNLGEGTYYVYGTGLAPTYCTSQTANAAVHEFNCSVFYTLTQGYYGGKNGKSCYDKPVPTILYLLNGVDLVVGTSNSITVPATQQGAVKLNQSLPGGGSANALPTGNCDITTPCFSEPLYLTKQGRINNILLAQTLTLSLNVRWNSGELLLFQLASGYLTTQKMSGCGPDAEPVETCDGNTIKSIKMNQAVIDYLGASNTVADLLQLANDVLGGTKTPGVDGVPSYTDVNDAVAAINVAFDEGRMFLDYYEEAQSCETLFPEPAMPLTTNSTTTNTTSSTSVSSTMITAEDDITLSAYPNPFTDNLNFVVNSKKSGKALLEVYNMTGQKVKTVFQGYIFAGTQRFTMTLPTQQRSNLFYIFTMNGERKTGKLLFNGSR